MAMTSKLDKGRGDPVVQASASSETGHTQGSQTPPYATATCERACALPTLRRYMTFPCKGSWSSCARAISSGGSLSEPCGTVLVRSSKYTGRTASSFQVRPAWSLCFLLVCTPHMCSSRLPHRNVEDTVARAERLSLSTILLLAESSRTATKP